MSLARILSLPVAEVAANSAHLYLWCPSTLLQEGLQVMAAWGFIFKTTVAWGKLTKKGKLAFGAGHYFRGAHELVLFGVRGRCPALNRSQRSFFLAKVGDHSRKPETLQDMAELVSPGPWLELFARRRRCGWRVWGDQIHQPGSRAKKAAARWNAAGGMERPAAPDGGKATGSADRPGDGARRAGAGRAAKLMP